VIKRLNITNNQALIVFLGSALCLLFHNNILGLLIFYLLYGLTVYDILRGRIQIFFSMLLFGSYHSDFPNIYTVDIGPVSGVYLLVLLLFFITILNISKKQINKNILFLLAPFILLYPIHIVLGFVFKYSPYLFFVDFFSFTSFYVFIIYITTAKSQSIRFIIKTLGEYVVIYYPFFILLSTLLKFHAPYDLFNDEFSKFQAIAFVPFLIFSKYKRWVTLVLAAFNLFALLLVALYGYFSSLNFVLIMLSLFVIALYQNYKLALRILAMVSIVGVIAVNVLLTVGSPKTIFKVKQIGFAAEYLIKDDIARIPFSPRLRLLEMLTSYADLKEMPMLVFTGKGFGSYFTYKHYPIQQYGIPTLYEKDAYEEESIDRMQFPRGHGFFSYALIKWGVTGQVLMVLILLLSFRVKDKRFLWITVSTPFYVLTTFGYGYKNFVFTGVLLGIVLTLFFNRNIDKKENYF